MAAGKSVLLTLLILFYAIFTTNNVYGLCAGGAVIVDLAPRCAWPCIRPSLPFCRRLVCADRREYRHLKAVFGADTLSKEDLRLLLAWVKAQRRSADAERAFLETPENARVCELLKQFAARVQCDVETLLVCLGASRGIVVADPPKAPEHKHATHERSKYVFTVALACPQTTLRCSPLPLPLLTTR